MSYKIIAVPTFRKELKKLAKKYSSIKEDFAALVEKLRNSPQHGTPLGMDCYKIRFSIASKGKGNQAVQELLLISTFQKEPYFCYPFTTSQKKKPLATKNCKPS